MVNKLHIDVETYSSIDIKTSGAYKYCRSIDFEMLMAAYAFNDEPIEIVDLAKGEKFPERFIRALKDPNTEKHAHNANFERNAFKAIGYDIPIEQWHCSAVKSAYCGLPLSLQMVSEALKLEEKGKLTTGRGLIKFFCVPCKPTNVNGKRSRNMYFHDKEKWNEFKLYCINDVEAEREIGKKLRHYKMPKFERDNYILDQQINDRGVLIDLDFAQKAYDTDQENSKRLLDQMKELTGVQNPNSPAQLKKWLGDAIGEEIKSLAKDVIPDIIEKAESEVVKEVLELRQRTSKTSIKKYTSMIKCACDDDRGRGFFQFYGANRTGRWAGRLVQLQNLKRNYLKDIAADRSLFATGDFDLIDMYYDQISDTLSQLIRTAFIAKPEYIFAVADFSAIEARVTAWLAGEQWRLDVFNSHGKIYEASAAMMFGVPVESITKGSDLRDKGKIAELALGYGGSVGALKQMGGEDMGLSEIEMKDIVRKWRAKSPSIVKLWKHIEGAAIRAIKTKKPIILPSFRNLKFEHDGMALTIQLPSGKKLFYQSATLTKNRWDQTSVKYRGLDQVTKKWWWVESYGGKFTENIVQAIARDVLADSMLRLNEDGFDIVMHIHDEAVAEIIDSEYSIDRLRQMEAIMGEEIPWAKDLPLDADGYLTPFYKKD